MISKHLKKPLLFLFIVILSFLTGFVSSSFANVPKKILILPFSFHSGENDDLKFLQNGINRMLYTRLRHTDKTQIIPLNSLATTYSDPIKVVGLAAGADYVLKGSITIFGNKISTDALFYSVKDQKELVTFGEFGNTKGDVLEHINRLAAKINQKVFNVQPALSLNEQKMMAARQTYGYQQKPSFGISKSFKFKSKVINFKIQNIAIADVDGDKTNELIFASKNSIKIVSFQNGKQINLGEKQISSFSTIIRIDAGDFNQNGKSEIFLTIANDKGLRNQSEVFEWQGPNMLKNISLPKNYFYAIHNNEFGIPVLTAQKRETGMSYKPGIFIVRFTDNKFSITSETIYSPYKSNILSFSSGNLFNDKQKVYASQSGLDTVIVSDNSGASLWDTPQEFSDGPVYFNTKNEHYNSKEHLRHYIPQRINIADLDNDGKTELILVKNKLSSIPFLKNVRTFKNGKIQIFSSRQDSMLQKVWESTRYPGVITDCIIGDLNNDGKNEIIFAVQMKSNKVLNFAGSKSYIVAKGFY